jgi:hypothetical protein
MEEEILSYWQKVAELVFLRLFLAIHMYACEDRLDYDRLFFLPLLSAIR